MLSSKKRPPLTSDSDINRALSQVYDDLNEIIDSVNQSLSTEEKPIHLGKEGDIRLYQDNVGEYYLEARVKDGWVVTNPLTFKRRVKDGNLVTDINIKDTIYASDTKVALGEFDIDSINATLSIGGTAAFTSGGELTIASGVITITHSYHTVDTQSDAGTDDLDTISGGTVAGQILIIRADSTRTVVAKDGTGNLKLSGHFSMDNAEDTLMLVYDGSNWLEVTRSNNGA